MNIISEKEKTVFSALNTNVAFEATKINLTEYAIIRDLIEYALANTIDAFLNYSDKSETRIYYEHEQTFENFLSYAHSEIEESLFEALSNEDTNVICARNREICKRSQEK